jgi:hypothetical protein
LRHQPPGSWLIGLGPASLRWPLTVNSNVHLSPPHRLRLEKSLHEVVVSRERGDELDKLLDQSWRRLAVSYELLWRCPITLGTFVVRKNDGATALASPLQAFSGWRLWLDCASCRLPRIVRVDDLIRRYGHTCALSYAMDRLRCDRCRKAPDWVRLADLSSARKGRQARAVQLVGTIR